MQPESVEPKPIEKEIFQALTAHGYSRVGPRTLRADWGTEKVKQFIHFRKLRMWAGHVDFHFSFRNDAAHDFAMSRWRTSTPPELQEIVRFGPFESFINVGMGKFLKWPFPCTLDVRTLGVEESMRFLAREVSTRLVPIFMPIADEATLFSFLVEKRNEQILPPSYPLAAQIIFLGKRLGITRSAIFAALDPILSLSFQERSVRAETDKFLDDTWDLA